VARPHEDFRADVARAVGRERWVVDGNYRSVRELVWARATAVVWLDYSFATVFGRVLARTLRRSITRQALWAGNRESLGRALFSPDSILHWVLTTHGRRRREYRRLRSGAEFSGLAWFVFTKSAEAESWLGSARVRVAANAQP
jgi:hypothetical protein